MAFEAFFSKTCLVNERVKEKLTDVLQLRLTLSENTSNAIANLEMNYSGGREGGWTRSVCDKFLSRR